MTLTYSIPTPLEYFATLVQDGQQDAVPLLEAAVSIAQDMDPRLDIQQVLSEVDALLARLRARLNDGMPVLERLSALHQFFYTELGFSGNLNNYYEPGNSYVPVVLRTRRGIPITLAVLWLELAQGIGLKAHGVAFPGHFLVKVLVPDGQIVLDPMTGQSLSREDLSERLEPFVVGRREPGSGEEPLAPYLRAATGAQIVARMLRNLKEIHRTEGNWAQMVAVQSRLVVLFPSAWEERRDRGLAYAEQGDAPQALSDLDFYLAHAGMASDMEAIQTLVLRLRESIG